MQGLKRSSGTQFSPEESGYLGQNAQIQGEKQGPKRQFLSRKLPVGYNGLHVRYAAVKTAKGFIYLQLKNLWNI